MRMARSPNSLRRRCEDRRVSETDLRMCLMLLRDRERILLGRKLTGFGKGKVIAPGGKLDDGEAAGAAACRELAEETGLRVDPRDTEPVASLRFTWADGSRPFAVDVFEATRWTGHVVPSAELEPFWCPLDQIPYEQMWDDDRIWLPAVLRGQRMRAVIGYDLGGQFVERVDLTPLGPADPTHAATVGPARPNDR